MTTGNVIRFDPNGPGGLERWEDMNPDDLASGTPVQNGYTYHEIEAEGYLAGVWDCTAFDDHMGNYSVDEFMWLIEGSVTMVMPDGSEVTTRAGEAFVIPKGLKCQWKQPGYVRKFFMILDGPVPEAGANASLLRVTKPDLSGASLGQGVEVSTDAFVNAAGTMKVTVRDCAETHVPKLAVAGHSLIHVLAGELRVAEGETEELFVPGDTAYIKGGTTLSWSTTKGTRLLQSTYTA